MAGNLDHSGSNYGQCSRDYWNGLDSDNRRASSRGDPGIRGDCPGSIGEPLANLKTAGRIVAEVLVIIGLVILAALSVLR
jgi:hypothetical protein